MGFAALYSCMRTLLNFTRTPRAYFAASRFAGVQGGLFAAGPADGARFLCRTTKMRFERGSTMKHVDIFTDGACSGNPGPGGYGAILCYGGKKKEIAQGFSQTTNNRMELSAAIEALRLLKEPCDVTLYSDSQYLINGITKGWAQKWRQNNWMRTKKDPALNADLWEVLLELCSRHHIQWIWVKGHAGHPENERCDRLAVEAAAQAAKQKL